jgi:hypothetical protein
MAQGGGREHALLEGRVGRRIKKNCAQLSCRRRLNSIEVIEMAVFSANCQRYPYQFLCNLRALSANRANLNVENNKISPLSWPAGGRATPVTSGLP